MPKIPTPARKPAMPTRVVRPAVGSGVPTTHMHRQSAAKVVRPRVYAPDVSETQPMEPTVRDTRSTVRATRSTSRENDDDDEFEIVHANCTKMVQTANERNQQLRTHIAAQRQEASEAAQKFGAERAQLNATIRQVGLERHKLVDELRNAKEEILSLQRRLDVADADVQNRITREELNKTLKEIHAASVSVTKQVATKISESDNIYFSSCLPSSDVGQGLWAGQGEHFGLPDDPLLSADLGPMPPSLDPQDLSQFDSYVAIP
ncbi:hypothetical protein N7466_011091 [Penicillium verhagenii]|uniref:uncharacterized protein n=1 Tax=Penicillium verhagenii TaxID=1562060 RepID=UPI002545BBC4|nr:uncharacterized protein N7466_011075 [Penicillium verhagenii]XP_057016212.1 uncharacterized protein N7466_011091 [Penicillium verhagenii]KAJ5917521.1 hypothetical protein N7466_011075 [Penicillium verhagenii]KAJ5917537.1 hypothetical protein N7466_011091 [Penicillium verhagenii]